MMIGVVFVGTALCTAVLGAGAEPTYAGRLGWPADARVVIFHVDDAGMSHDSNVGTIEAMTNGAATSASVMFPCAWVSEFAKFAKEHPEMDVGVHLTLTSEWDKYRWGPAAGKRAVPGLVDQEGCLWPGTDDVTAHASAEEVDTEIRAQLERCLKLGIKPTHLDSHMGVLFARPDYAERYVKLGIEKDIPVLAAGGHLQYVSVENAEAADMARAMAKQVWEAGLPVLDDIHTGSYGWKNAEEEKREILAFLKTMKPGITEFIVHCTEPSPEFEVFSGSGPTRKADLMVMTDPEVKRAIEDEGIILTTWRELKERRDKIAK